MGFWTASNAQDTLLTAIGNGYGWFDVAEMVDGPGEYPGLRSIVLNAPSDDYQVGVNPYDDCGATVTASALAKTRDRIIKRDSGVNLRDDLLAQLRSSGDDYDVDADAADCLLQIHVFGEVVFG